MSRVARTLSTLVAMAAALALLPLATLAHDHRAILNDEYEITVGFITEPAYAGELNWLWFSIVQGDRETGTPVAGLTDSLEAEVIFGDQSMPLKLSPVFDEEGAYRGIFIPTTPGDYTCRISGAIDGQAIDESFTSSSEGFDSVQDPGALQFPKVS